MNVALLRNLVLVLFSILQFASISAKKKSLKIIIPNRIKYVHHHHTHVFVVKEKKPQKEREHRVHYYDKGKSKAVNHHIYIPYIHPQVDDEEEEESFANYAVAAAPNSRQELADSRYHFAREIPLAFEKPTYPVYSNKYRFYGSFDREQPSDDSMEYYDSGPSFSAVKSGRRSFMERPSEVGYERRNGVISPGVSYDEDRTYSVRHLFYPDKRFLSKRYNNFVIN